MRLSIVAVIALTTLLGGCVTAVFDPRACPPVREYSKAELQKLAAAYEKSPPEIKRAVGDYLKLRDKARACRGERRQIGRIRRVLNSR